MHLWVFSLSISQRKVLASAAQASGQSFKKNASERVCKREGLTSPGLGSTASTVELWKACSRERATAEDSYCLAWKSVWGTWGHGRGLCVVVLCWV